MINHNLVFSWIVLCAVDWNIHSRLQQNSAKSILSNGKILVSLIPWHLYTVHDTNITNNIQIWSIGIQRQYRHLFISTTKSPQPSDHHCGLSRCNATYLTHRRSVGFHALGVLLQTAGLQENTASLCWSGTAVAPLSKLSLGGRFCGG